MELYQKLINKKLTKNNNKKKQKKPQQKHYLNIYYTKKIVNINTIHTYVYIETSPSMSPGGQIVELEAELRDH